MAPKRFIRQTLKKITVSALIGIVAFGSLMIIPLSHVSATQYDGNGGGGGSNLFDGLSVEKQAQVWSSIEAAANTQAPSCPARSGLNTVDITAGNWLDPHGSVNVGHHVAPDAGTIGCDNENSWFLNLLTDAGFGTDFITPAKQIFKNPVLTGDSSTDPIGPNQADDHAHLKKMFAMAFFSSYTMPATAPDYLAYQILLANFTAPKACNAKVVPANITVNDMAVLKNNKDNKFVDILVYDAATQNRVSTKFYYQDTGAVSVGYGLNVGGAADGKLECLHIANELKNPKYTTDRIAYGTAHPTTADTGSGAGTSSSDLSLNCGSSKLAVLSNPLNWLMCPIIESLSGIARGLDNGINNMLKVNVQETFAKTTDGSGYYGAWQQMRIYAIVFLVIATLIIVISQALGFEFLDAYTVRKVLPRLLIAAVAISISWELMTFFVQLTNDLGKGIQAIIFSPFSKMLDGNTINLGGGGLFIADLIGAGAIVALGVAGLLSFIATAALAVAVAFFVLVLRQILISLLIILAPIAIVAYILPNTQKVWKLWWESFSKGLMMFPIIIAFISVGRVVAVTASSKGGALNSFIAFVAYFAPYLLLPMTFKFAGGLIGNLGGFVNDKGRGAFDGLKRYRGNKTKENFAKMRAGNRFEGSRFAPGSRTLAKGFNRGTAGVSSGMKGHFGLGARGTEAIDQTRRTAAGDIMKGPQFNAIKDDENALRAVTYDNDTDAKKGVYNHLLGLRNANGSAKYTATEAATETNRAITSAKASIGFGRPQAVAATQQMINTGTAVSDVEDLARTIARAAGGNNSTIAGLSGFANSTTKQTGRHDLAPSFGTLNSLARAESGALRGGTGPSSADYDVAHENAWNSASLYQHANDKPKNIEAAISHFTPLLSSASNADKEKAAVFFNELKAMQPNASGDVKIKINDVLTAQADNLQRAVDSLPSSPPTLGASSPIRNPELPGVPLTRNPTTGEFERNNVVTARGDSARERIERASRTYERVDPNRL